MADTDPWKTRSDEEEADNLFFEEDGNEETENKKKAAQDEVKNAGMLPVSGPEWKEKLKETLNEACKDEQTKKTLAPYDKIFESVERAGKATCFVLRRMNSDGRLKYFEKINDQKRLNKAKTSKGGNGTGFLMYPKHIKYGWLVITNNHVIMDEDEAKSAEVIFDYLHDDSKAGTRRFKVKQLVSSDVRTDNAQDFKSLDFSVLALESDEIPQESEDTKNTLVPENDSQKSENVLEEHAVMFEESSRVNVCTDKPFLKICGLEFSPIIAFSHPRGLSKHLSIGKYPDKCETYPTAHIKHDLPTKPGSSGANLIFSFPERNGKFSDWKAAFVHYRHNNAVAWQAIGDLLRKDLLEEEDDEEDDAEEVVL